MARKKSAAKKAREEAEKSGEPTSEAKPANNEKASSKKVTIQVPSDYSEELSSSEEEDEHGELITENVQGGIDKVLEALRTDPLKLLDPNAKFFNDPEKDVAFKQKVSEKPIYLKDYHRMNLISGDFKTADDEDDNAYGTIDGEKPFVVTEREERNQLLSDIKNAFNDEEDDEEDSDDGFLKKKVTKREVKETKAALPDPIKDEQGFLNAFLDNQAWIPTKNDKVIDLDQIDKEDEEDFDDAVEDFEKAYNFRYEDANSAEIVSYARNQATLRRAKTNSRKRQRDKKLDAKLEEERQTEELLKKKKIQKVNTVLDRLTKIKQAVGEEISDDVVHKVFGDSLLDDDFDDADWDSKMAQIFDEQYYGNEMEKPVWGDDDEVMAEFKSQGEEDKDKEAESGDSEAEAEAEVAPKKSKKESLKEKKSAKKQKQSLKEKAQQIVESNSLKLLDEVDEQRGRSNEKEEVVFKYRDVSPESFGLTTRDILLADDKQLNNFIGIKKFAPYKPKEQALKDKRKYTKKKRLQEWRKEVFHDKNGAKYQDGEKEGEIWIPLPDEDNGDEKKTKKRKHTHKHEPRKKKAN